MITISLRPKCFTAYFGREDETVAQFRTASKAQMRIFEKMTNTMFVHKCVEASHNQKRKEDGY